MQPCPSSPVRHRSDGSRYRILAFNADYEAALVHYPSGVEHPDHEHDLAQLSFLLCGGFAEEAEGRESEPHGPRHGFKPEGARHRCRFGRDGALILSVNFFDKAPLLPMPAGWQWTGPEMARLYRLLFARGRAAAAVIDDLMGAIGLELGQPMARADAPQWLARVAEEFADDPLAEVGEVAGRAGLHRVHLSRAFQKHFGLSPTQYRLQCKAARAVRLMIEDGERPGMAAAAAGFADQAHFTRTARALTGMVPGRMRQLLAA